MSIETLINRECLLLQRESTGTTDELGNETKTDSVTATVVELQPRTADEGTSTEEISADDFTAFFLPSEDLTTADAIVVDGLTYEFVGKPPTWRSPLTALSYIEAPVRRVAGAGDGS